jgi:hypothetical protein
MDDGANEVTTVMPDSGDLAGQPVLQVDFAPKSGLKEVSLSPQDLVARSSAAVDSAMASIREIADRVSSTTSQIVNRPDEVSVEFGLKLDAAGGALIARAEVEAHFVVTLKWSVSDE